MSISRRRLLTTGGGLALAGGLAAACGSNTGRDDNDSRSQLSQWYHQYGEAGTEPAVRRYAKAYGHADVRVQW
ncbi:sugar ABC transporter substrate-binding protein, partial [Streptomyces syringium]